MFKPLIKWRAKAITWMFLIAGLIMIGIGVYFTFFKGADYVKATAEISKVEQEDDPAADSGVRDVAWVRYTVDGKEYEEKLDGWDPGYKLGKEVKVKYDPRDPSKVISDSPGLIVYLIGVGAVILIVSAFSLLKNKKNVKAVREEQTAPLFTAPRRGAAERKLYFLTDLGTAKGGCHIEDAARRNVYEAVCTKFSLVVDSTFTFIDHALGHSQTHMIGKVADTESDAFYALDKHSTFDVDGNDVWKLLHNNGITIKSGLNGLRPCYRILRSGEEIAYVELTGRYPHEEDEEKHKIAKLALANGFYRIRTNEENLDAIFLTVFAISKTDMMIYQ
jgi:hypothetical protein